MQKGGNDIGNDHTNLPGLALAFWHIFIFIFSLTITSLFIVEILEPIPRGVAVEVRSFERSQQVDFRTTDPAVAGGMGWCGGCVSPWLCGGGFHWATPLRCLAYDYDIIWKLSA